MKKTFSILITLIVVSAFFVQPVLAASTKEEVLDLKEEVAALKAGQEGMQKDLEEIKKLLEQGARAPAVAAPSEPRFEETAVSVGNAPYLGSEDATVTLMEFSDYQCPFCSRHYREVMPTLVKEYVDTGKLKYVMRENPIQSIHPRAMAASQAALCAHDQGKYWEMHNLIFENQRELADENLKAHATAIGLDSSAFDQCLDSGKYQERVQDDLVDGRDLGIRGTPGFLLGLTDPDNPNEALMMEFINGAKSLDEFQRAINDLLEEAAGEG